MNKLEHTFVKSYIEHKVNGGSEPFQGGENKGKNKLLQELIDISFKKAIPSRKEPRHFKPISFERMDILLLEVEGIMEALRPARFLFRIYA